MKKKEGVAVFIILLMIFSLILVSSQAVKVKKTVNESVSGFDVVEVTEEYSPVERYIIEFKEDPVSVKKKALDDEITALRKEAEKAKNEGRIMSASSNERKLNSAITKQSRELKDYKKDLEFEHTMALNDINAKFESRGFAGYVIRNFRGITGNAIFRITGNDIFEDKAVRVEEEYFNVFNGVTLEISEEDLEKVKSSKYVKNVYPDEEAQVVLYDSVPLIRADDVWNLLDFQGSQIRGNGTTIAIIDTGVDYTHPDLGNSTLSGRDFFKVTPDSIYSWFWIDAWHGDQQFKLDSNKLAYADGNRIYIYDFDSDLRQRIDVFSSNLTVIRLAFDGDYLAYFATDELDNDENAGVYLYNLNTAEHLKIYPDIVASMGLIFLTDEHVVYGINGKDVYAYNLVTRSTNKVGNRSYMFYAKDNLVITPDKIGSTCYDFARVYDLETDIESLVYAPDIGPVFDKQDDTFLYVGCSKDNFDPEWSITHVYNMTSGQVLNLSYPEVLGGGGGGESVNDLGVTGYINKGAIGEEVYFFSKDAEANKIVAYDKLTQEYVIINPLKTSGMIDAEGNKICFLSSDMNIYCHDYNRSGNYSIPEVVFNDKVIGGYDFYNDDSDPMDDHGHGTHVAGTAAGRSIGVPVAENYIRLDDSYDFIEADVEMFDGGDRFGVLYGNYTDFTGVGSYFGNKLATSKANQLIVNISDYTYGFVVSLNSSTSSKSYSLNPEIYFEDGVNKVRIYNNAIYEIKCDNLTVGDVCIIGLLNLTVDEIVNIGNDQWTRFSVGNGGSFDKVFDIAGNYIYIPQVSELPLAEYTFNIYNSDDEIIETHSYYWLNNRIYEENLDRHYFDFDVFEDEVFVDVPLVSGDYRLSLLYSDVDIDIFEGIGKNTVNRLVVSNSDTLLFNDTRGDEEFVASWNNATYGESYVLKCSNIGTRNGANRTDIYNKVSGAPLCSDLAAGDNCFMGLGIELTINRVHSYGDEKWVELSISGDGSFNEVFDTSNHFITLPLESAFPRESWAFDIYDLSLSFSEEHEFQCRGGYIAHYVSSVSADSGGGGGGGGGGYLGLNGVAPDAQIYAYKVCSSGGSCPNSDMMAAVDRSIDPNEDGDLSDMVDVISMSLGRDCGGYDPWCGPDDVMSTAMDNAVSAGIVASISAGNSGPGYATIGSPGTSRKAIAVAASDDYDFITYFSSRGPVEWEDVNGTFRSISKPDIAAPGSYICAAQWDGAWSSSECYDEMHVAISGTSMAAPHIAGAVALVKQAHPNWTPEEIKSALKYTSVDIGYDAYTQGSGRVDVYEAVSLLSPILLTVDLSNDESNIYVDLEISGQGLDYYSLDYQLSDADDWNNLGGGGIVSEHTELQFVYDRTELDSGSLVFRVNVTNNLSSSFTEASSILNDNFEITQVGNEFNYLINSPEKVYASVLRGEYSNYSIYAARRVSQVEYAYWNLVYSSEEQLLTGGVGEIDTSLLEGGVYKIKIVAQTEQGNLVECQGKKDVILMKDFDRGLAVNLVNNDPKFLSVVDFEGQNDIVLHSMYPMPLGGGWYTPRGMIEVWRNGEMYSLIDDTYDGTDIYWLTGNGHQGFAIYSKNFESYIVDHDAPPEWMSDSWRKGGIIDLSGNYLFEWPFMFGDNHSQLQDYLNAPPIIYDDKIIFAHIYRNYSLRDLSYDEYTRNIEYKLRVFNRDGQLINLITDKPLLNEDVTDSAFHGYTFPINLKDSGQKLVSLVEVNSLYYPTYENTWLDVKTYDLVSGSLRGTGRVNQESDEEIVSFVTPFSVVDNGAGIIVVPLFLRNQTLIDEGFWSDSTSTYFYYFDSDGNLLDKAKLNGYQATSEPIAFNHQGENYIAISAWWHDDQEGIEHSKIFILDMQGNVVSEIEPINTLLESPPSVIRAGDIDNDGDTEIVAGTRPRYWEGSPSFVRIYDFFGELEKNITIYSAQDVAYINDIGIADYNGDGMTDLVIATAPIDSDSGDMPGGLFVANLGTVYNESVISWPYKWHDMQRSNCYGCAEKANINAGLIFNQQAATDQNHSIKVKIENSYMDLTNLNYDVFYSRCDYASRESCSYLLLDHDDIPSLLFDEGYEKDIEHLFDQEGEYVLKFNLTSNSGEFEEIVTYYQLNSQDIYVDLSTYIWYLSGVSVNISTKINAEVDNWGTKDALVNISLYYQEGYCARYTPCENLSLVLQENDVLIRPGDWEVVSYDWTPDETGEFTFVVNATSEEEVDDYDNVYYRTVTVRGIGADLNPYIYYTSLTEGVEGFLDVEVSNLAGEVPENPVLDLFFQGEMCDYAYGGCDNLTLIASRNLDFGGSFWATESFSFTPFDSGYYTFVALVNATNEIYPEDNWDERWIDVRERGPDPSLRTLYLPDYLYIDEEVNATFELYNYGTEVAENITLELYEGVWDDKGWHYELRGTGLVASVDAGETVYVNVSFTPVIKGYLEAMGIISAVNDIYIGNNDYWESSVVLINGLDVEVDFGASSEEVGLGDSVYINYRLENFGDEDAYGLGISYYADGELIGNNTLAQLQSRLDKGTAIYYNAFMYTPNKTGKELIEIRIDVPGDIDTSNNRDTLNLTTYGLKNATINISDSQGNSVPRYIYVNNNYAQLNDSHTFEVLDGAELDFMAIAYWFRAPGDGVAVIPEVPYLSDQEFIVSEYYDKISQDGNDYYSVFANEYTFDAFSDNYYMMLNSSWLEGLGMNISDIYGYTIYSCRDFNFTLQSCNEFWAEIDEMDIDSIPNGFGFEGYSDYAAEAFAVSEIDVCSGDESTNLSVISGDTVQNFVCEQNSLGRIKFLEAVNVSRLRADMSMVKYAFRLRLRKADLDVYGFPEFANKSAEILLKNIDFVNPIILYNSDNCPADVCSDVYYNSTGDYMLFNVTGFSRYEIIEGCGDSVCEGIESNANCPSDCPPAEDADDDDDNSGGGGGGGGGDDDDDPRDLLNITGPSGPITTECQTGVCDLISHRYCNNGLWITEDYCSYCREDGVCDEGILPRRSNWTVILLLVVLTIAVVVVSITITWKYIILVKQESDYTKIAKAKGVVRDARKWGYSDEDIKKRFKEKGWKDNDIKKIIK